MTVDIKSNSNQTLKNILLNANYPFGYTFISSSVKPITSDNATWSIGDIQAGGDRSIIIHGKLQGENSDSKSFRFSVGAQDSTNSNQIGTEYMSLQQDITLQKPFISLGVTIDSDSSPVDFIGEFGRSHRVDVYWFNNLTVPVTNAVITAHISGDAYDKNSVSPSDGYFRSDTGDIVWNQQTTPGFASIGAGDSGHVSFSIVPRDMSTGSNLIVNPMINITANVSGDRTQEAQVPESLTALVSRNIRVSSRVALSGRIVRSVGPFTNTGPIPPKAESTTTYTVSWTVDNTSSAVTNTKIVATLPAYVKWLGNVSPDSESLMYDNNSGTVTWDIGSLSTYTSNSSRRRQVYFQIALLPGVDLIGQSPILVNAATLTAMDSFTGSQLQGTQNPLLTSFSTDPAFRSDDGIVKQ